MYCEKTWPLLITLQVLVSSLIPILTRKLSLANERVFFVVGFGIYAVIAVSGFVYSFVFGGIEASYIPTADELVIMVFAATGIVTSWLLRYQIITILGASSTILVGLFSYVVTALFGFVFLNEPVSETFIIGAALLAWSIWIVFRLKNPDTNLKPASIQKKIVLVIAMSLLFAGGMMLEKVAIDSMGVWEYARFGWAMQFVIAAPCPSVRAHWHVVYFLGESKLLSRA